MLPEACFRGGLMDWARDTGFAGPPVVCRGCLTTAAAALNRKRLRAGLDEMALYRHDTV